MKLGAGVRGFAVLVDDDEGDGEGERGDEEQSR